MENIGEVLHENLKKYFGFEANQDDLFNPVEPNVCFVFSENTQRNKSIIPAQLIFESDDNNQNESILNKLNLDYTSNNGQISLEETYSGYPITISTN